ncbi:MAG: hypothetical protein C6P36_16330 [Geobacillus sp.]|nr:MAG: hypothetical protein C6P36_16330 [Geobacillus sp.]
MSKSRIIPTKRTFFFPFITPKTTPAAAYKAQVKDNVIICILIDQFSVMTLTIEERKRRWISVFTPNIKPCKTLWIA